MITSLVYVFYLGYFFFRIFRGKVLESIWATFFAIFLVILIGYLLSFLFYRISQNEKNFKFIFFPIFGPILILLNSSNENKWPKKKGLFLIILLLITQLSLNFRALTSTSSSRNYDITQI